MESYRIEALIIYLMEHKHIPEGQRLIEENYASINHLKVLSKISKIQEIA